MKKGEKRNKKKKKENTKFELYTKRKLTRTNVSMKSQKDVNQKDIKIIQTESITGKEERQRESQRHETQIKVQTSLCKLQEPKINSNRIMNHRQKHSGTEGKKNRVNKRKKRHIKTRALGNNGMS